MKILGISGKKKSGKTTVANMIAKYVPNTVVINFADPLKVEVAKATGVSVEYLNNNKDMFRLILQGWGTDFRRAKDESYWIDKWLTTVLQLPDTTRLVIASDVRFPNEFDTIKYYGECWHITKDNSADTHPSENALDSYQFDCEISNTHTLNTLEQRVCELIQQKKLNE